MGGTLVDEFTALGSMPGLDALRIAGQNCGSVRALNRLCAAEGITANPWIPSPRLAASHKAACDCGFNDLPHSGRVFNRRV